MAPVLRKREESPYKKGTSAKVADQPIADQQRKQPRSGVRIPGAVLGKLIVFSVLAISLPILVFYYTLQYGSTSAGIMAALTANFVLIMYIVVAYLEDDDSSSKKDS